MADIYKKEFVVSKTTGLTTDNTNADIENLLSPNGSGKVVLLDEKTYIRKEYEKVAYIPLDDGDYFILEDRESEDMCTVEVQRNLNGTYQLIKTQDAEKEQEVIVKFREFLEKDDK